MKRRYFFDLQNGHLLHVDETGVQAVDLNEAVDAAYAILNEMHDNDDAPVEPWTLIIRGEDGASLKTLCLASGVHDRSKASAPRGFQQNADTMH